MVTPDEKQALKDWLEDPRSVYPILRRRFAELQMGQLQELVLAKAHPDTAYAALVRAQALHEEYHRWSSPEALAQLLGVE